MFPASANLARAPCGVLTALSLQTWLRSISLLWMRLEINLAAQVRDVEFAHVMPKQCDWHDQRNQAAAVVVDQRDEFGARRRVEMLAKVAEHVLQHVGVTGSGRELLQRGHECEFVVVADVVARQSFCVGDESAELAVSFRRM